MALQDELKKVSRDYGVRKAQYVFSIGERDLDLVLDRLRSRVRKSAPLPQPQDTAEEIFLPQDITINCHVGAGGFANLDIIAAVRSERAVLFDINTRQAEMWEVVERVIAQSDNRSEFVEKFTLELISMRAIHGDADLIGMKVREEMKRGLSWLGSDKNFSYIKELFAEGKIGWICLDITDKNGFSELFWVLKNEGCSVQTFYRCNIPEFLKHREDVFTGRNRIPTESMEQLRETTSAICDSNTVIIDADYKWEESKYFVTVKALSDALKVSLPTQERWGRGL